MKLNHLHWIETAEYFCVAASVIGSVVAVASENLVYALVPIALTLVISLINRLRSEQRHRKQVRLLMNQLQQLSQTYAELEQQLQKKGDGRGNVSVSHSSAIAYLQEDVTSLEASVSRVVQYLNQSSFSTRVEYLENVTSQLIAEVTGVSPEDTEDGKETLESSPVVKQKLQEESSASPIVIQSLSRQKSSLRLPLQESPTPETSLPPSPRWTHHCTLEGHTDWVSSLAVSPNDQLLASASWDKTVKLWNIETGTCLDTSTEDAKGLCAVTFAGNNTIVAGGYDQTLKIWTIERGETGQGNLILQNTLTGHIGSIRSLAIAPDQLTLLSGSYDQTVKIWWLERGEILHSLRDASGGINAIALSTDGQLIASGGGAGSIRLWQWGNSEQLGVLQGNPLSIDAIAISPNRNMIVAGCVNGTIKIWNMNSNNVPSFPTAVLSGHTGQVMALQFSPDGQTLISGSTDCTIRFWHLESQRVISTLQTDGNQQPLNKIISLALIPTSQLLAAGSIDGKIHLWQEERDYS